MADVASQVDGMEGMWDLNREGARGTGMVQSRIKEGMKEMYIYFCKP